jgi:hypothetical protein
VMTDKTSSEPVAIDSERIFYTASPFARSSLLYLQEMGGGKTLPAHMSDQRNIQSWLFFVVRQGSGSFSYRGKKYDLREGSCVLLTAVSRILIRWIRMTGRFAGYVSVICL